MDTAIGTIYEIRIAMIILITGKVIGGILSFLLGSLLMGTQDYKPGSYLWSLSELVKESPYFYGIVLRFASIPVVLRNMGMALLPLGFLPYLLACIM